MCGDVQAPPKDTEAETFRCGPLLIDPEADVVTGAELGGKSGSEAGKIASDLWKPAGDGKSGSAVVVTEILRKMGERNETVPVDKMEKLLKNNGWKKIDFE